MSIGSVKLFKRGGHETLLEGGLNNCSMGRKKFVEITPHAANLTTSLQGMTYDFSKAIADIIDNSIAAHATKIWVEIRDGVADRFVSRYRVVDNGHGMTEEKLQSSMTYGAVSEENSLDLGRFGLGMKTASMSQCQVLTVASKSSPDAELNALQLNLNYLREEAGGSWNYLYPDIEQEIPMELPDLIKETSGTIVLWKDLTRLNPNIGSLNAHNLVSFLDRNIRECEKHIAAVYHRFIDGTTRTYDGKISFKMNGRV